MVIAASVVVVMPHRTTTFVGRIFRARLACIAFWHAVIKMPSGVPWRATATILRDFKKRPNFEKLHQKHVKLFLSTNERIMLNNYRKGRNVMLKESAKLIVLTFVSHYLPGYKSGGPLRTILNMVDRLDVDLSFWIVTRDRDLGDDSQYAGILPNQWQSVGGAMVYYLSPENCTVKGFADLIAKTNHDIIYLNSYFEYCFTIKPLLARKFGWLPQKPVIIAPRGEFSAGAIRLKYCKKMVYIQLAKRLRLYADVTWHASSEFESMDIQRIIGVTRESIHVAVDMPRAVLPTVQINNGSKIVSVENSLRVVFVSRISPKKNLSYALNMLANVKDKILYDIYGPIEDISYWKKCEYLISKLPSNVEVQYKGCLHPDEVAKTFSCYDLFYFPTLGENYGHVIAESLSVGTPVLISDQTPWRNLPSNRFGWDLALDDMPAFEKTLHDCAGLSEEDKLMWRNDILINFQKYMKESTVLNDNRELFIRTIQKYALENQKDKKNCCAQ